MACGKLSVLIAAPILAFTLTAGARSPDMVLVDGKIITLESRRPIAEALAIEGERITAVGKTEDIAALAGPETRVIDLSGRTVVPGLIDSHIHAIRGGLTYNAEIRWTDAPSLAEGLARLAAAARRTPPGTWLEVVGGWHKSQFPEGRLPRPDELNAITGDHPIYVQYQYEAAVLNRAAMRALEIETDADVAPAGRLAVDGDGRPTGLIHGNVPTFARLFARLPAPDLDGQVAGTRAFFRELNGFGLTGIVDAAGGGLFADGYRPLFHIWRHKELTLRVAYRVMAPVPGDELARLQDYARMLPQGLGGDMLKFNGFGEVLVWGMHDGHRAGMSFDPSPQAAAALRETAAWMAARGYTVEIHASSDSSARQILDIFEAVNKQTPITGLRWVIAHIEDAGAATLARMKALGMGYTVQDRLYFAADELRGVVGPEGMRRAPPIGTALALGLPVAAGTDALRVTPYNPWIAIRWLLDGRSVTGGPTRAAGQIPTRMEALRMYSLNGAWMSFDEGRRGSLAPGKLADLAVLSADYLTIPVDEIDDIHSLLTILGGHPVHAGGPFARFR